ncbi:carbon-nitrogen hydrolase family protein [Halomonas kalidii]|uniref:Carbon-nitrogen hydrolase family protein n=1 Tax=Halomonas kalidii TaxID=3043293 RepID=A0ABT6VMT7_9GAMM|nr:carbon-nitrogen hydrolase family protein [Halomonas kalidii]MDI5935287.1 carbon-nitrogen hydrolase family protein [Halomonas kalidii]
MINEIVICAAQMAPNSEDKRVNADRILKMIGDAAKENAKIIAFPECALTPFFTLKNTKDFDHYFDTVPNEITSEIMKSAKDNDISVILPYAEKTNIRYYNSAAVINSKGQLIGNYRKVHIPGAFVQDEVKNFEKIYFTPGDLGFPCFDLDGVRVGIQICYDRHFPEGFRSLALSGAQIIFNVTGAGAYGKPWRSDSWELLLRARAFENGVYVVGVNKIGLEYGQDYFGRSLVASPLGGEITGKTQDHGEDELLIKRIDLDDITEARKRLPAFRDIRIDQYADIYRNINQ